MSRAWAGIVFGCALTGCAAILGLEHLGADDAAVGDSGSETDGAGVTSDGASPVDASRRDGPPGAEGGTDGGIACSGWCGCFAPDAQFCADFDDPSPLEAGRFAVTVEAGSLVVASDASSSAPNALESTIAQNNFGAAAFVSRSFGGMPNKRFVVRFELRVDSCVKSFTTDAVVALRVNSGFRATLSRTDVDGDALVVGSNNSYALAPMYVRPDTWMKVRLDVDTENRKEYAQVDDASFTYPIQAADDPMPASAVVVELGQNAAPSSACRLHIDNVTFDSLP